MLRGLGRVPGTATKAHSSRVLSFFVFLAAFMFDGVFQVHRAACTTIFSMLAAGLSWMTAQLPTTALR